MSYFRHRMNGSKRCFSEEKTDYVASASNRIAGTFTSEQGRAGSKDAYFWK